MNNHKETIICSFVIGIGSAIIYQDKCKKVENKYILEKKMDSLMINQLSSKVNEKNKIISELYSLIKTLAGAGTQAGSSKCARTLRKIRR